MKKIFNILIEHCLALYRVYLLGHLPLFWFRGTKNFGDVLNVYLAEKLSKKKVVWVNPSFWPFKHYLMIGSIVQFARRKSIIWGSGVISESSEIPSPYRVLATRGPMSQARFSSTGISCPSIYGDPAILLPTFYTPKCDIKKWKLGVVPHYVDKNNDFIAVLRDTPDVCILNIETDNVEKFVDELNQCEAVISSSLHGIIVAEAYGIPAGWLVLSDKLMGGAFKFNDYYESTGRSGIKPVALSEDGLDIPSIISQIPIDRPKSDIKALLSSCPFYSND